MTLPATGTIAMDQVNVELQKSATALATLNDADIRALAGIPSGTISLDNLHGKTGPLNTLNFLATSTSVSSTIVVPATVQAGDLMVLFDGPAFSSTTGISGPVPTGFTNLGAGPTGGWTNGIIMSAKIAVAGDAGTTLTGANGNSRNAKVLTIIRGNVTVSTFNVVNVQASATNNDPPGFTVSSAGVSGPAVLACCGSSGTNVVNMWQGYPSTFTTPAFGLVTQAATRMVTGFSNINRGVASYDQRCDLQDYGSGNMMRAGYIVLT